MSVSGKSTLEGTVNAQEINITDNKTIMMNANPLHTFNKCKRYEYTIQHTGAMFTFIITDHRGVGGLVGATHALHK